MAKRPSEPQIVAAALSLPTASRRDADETRCVPLPAMITSTGRATSSVTSSGIRIEPGAVVEP
jgi:hypothetical protein